MKIKAVVDIIRNIYCYCMITKKDSVLTLPLNLKEYVIISSIASLSICSICHVDVFPFCLEQIDDGVILIIAGPNENAVFFYYMYTVVDLVPSTLYQL